jgi:fermentation-respiration switch protein FrsA (DUF1100 family)
MVRNFTAMPMFAPLRCEPEAGHEAVRFQTADGYSLAGTYFRARSSRRAGVIVFCHEYLGDRWSVVPYAEGLRDLGFDLFSFDFRNHGESESEPGYDPLHWVSDREKLDLEAALQYLRSRPDHDPSGFGLYGISRGGGTAIAVGSREADVWGVVTDGAFPTRGTLLTYVMKNAQIYVGRWFFWQRMPVRGFDLITRVGLLRTEWELGRSFDNLERSIARLAPRPLLMIHGKSDSYIAPQVAKQFFDRASEPKQLWLVPKAKHNRCRDVAPEAYRRKITGFFAQWAPRRLADSAGTESHPDFLEPAGLGVRLTAGLAVQSSQVS